AEFQRKQFASRTPDKTREQEEAKETKNPRQPRRKHQDQQHNNSKKDKKKSETNDDDASETNLPQQPTIDMPYVSEAEKPILAPPEHNCANCETRYTPMWRKVEGKIYCNKCALYYYRTGRPRPLTMGINKNSKRRKRVRDR